MTYGRCADCKDREIGLWPVLRGRRRVYLCGECAERSGAALDDARPILGPKPSPEAAQLNWAAVAEVMAGHAPRRRRERYDISEVDEALGEVPVIEVCRVGHRCGAYGGSHQPGVANRFCECRCHEPA